MKNLPASWSTDALAKDAATSIAQFRAERLAGTDEWTTQYNAAHDKFSQLLKKLGDLAPAGVTDANLAEVYRLGLGEALRYLAGPPISDDDLQVIADVDSLTPNVLRRDHTALRKVFNVIERLIDPYRFPWTASGHTPTEEQREVALLASSVMLAAQRIETDRRNEAKVRQETMVKDYLCSLGFVAAPAAKINTIMKGPQAMQFFAESLLGDRKADVVVRLHDTRLMALECKVSNSATNSVKRLNNDAAVKAEYWNKEFGISQVVPAAVLSGVFNVMNLEQAQARGLALFWSHDLEKLGAFIKSTGPSSQKSMKQKK